MTPFSVLIIANGRDDLLQKCLDSLRIQETTWQLIVVANGLLLSETIRARARGLTPEVDFLELSEKRTLAEARSSGLEFLRHGWTLVLEEEAYVLSTYFEAAAPLLLQERVQVLGGLDIPAKGLTPLAEAWALTLASPFCTGPGFSRHQSKGKKLIPVSEENISTAHLWVRTELLKQQPSLEQVSFLVSLKGRGFPIHYHPALVAGYHHSNKLGDLIHRAFESGHSRSRTMKENGKRDSGLFWLPALFVLLHLLILTRSPLFWDLARIYAVVIIMMSLNLAARRKRLALFLHMTVMHHLIVFTYGVGFLAQRAGIKYDNH